MEDRSETKNSVSVLVLHTVVLVLVLQVWCCVVKHDLVTLVVKMILKDTATFPSTIYSFCILCLEHHYCGDTTVAFTYLKVKSANTVGLHLLIVTQEIRHLSCSWFCYFGLGLVSSGLSLGLKKNFILFTSLILTLLVSWWHWCLVCK